MATEESTVSNANLNEFKDNDNLDLTEINVPDIPNDILFPEELNQYLRGQIQFLSHANGMLKKTLSEKEFEIHNNLSKINDLTLKVSKYEQFTKTNDRNIGLGGNTQHLMSAKIIELSKKLRDKNAEFEALKTKCSKLQQKIDHLENCVTQPETNKPDLLADKNDAEKTIADAEDEIKTLNEKISQLNNKLFETKNNNIHLQNQINTANKILKQELGESFVSLQNFTSNNNANWRGRAQIILGLQQKNAELQEKLMHIMDRDSSINVPKPPDTRKQVIEQQQKEIHDLKTEIEEQKKKITGARARTKVLENECFCLKTKLNTLSSKSDHDDKLIGMLTNQVSTLDETNSGMKKEKLAGVQKLEDKIKSLSAELYKEKLANENLKKSLEGKELLTKELQNDICSLRNNFDHCPTNSASSLFKENQRFNILEVEVNRLLELVRVLNKRLDDERDNHCKMQLSYRKERQKAAKLEVKLSRIELENNMNKSPISYTNARSFIRSSANSVEETNSLNVEILRNNLEMAEENISVLKTKLDIVQKEKELDFQQFSLIIGETTGLVKKYNAKLSNMDL